jgi:hypothetical protein
LFALRLYCTHIFSNPASPPPSHTPQGRRGSKVTSSSPAPKAGDSVRHLPGVSLSSFGFGSGVLSGDDTKVTPSLHSPDNLFIYFIYLSNSFFFSFCPRTKPFTIHARHATFPFRTSQGIGSEHYGGGGGGGGSSRFSKRPRKFVAEPRRSRECDALVLRVVVVVCLFVVVVVIVVGVAVAIAAVCLFV